MSLSNARNQLPFNRSHCLKSIATYEFKSGELIEIFQSISLLKIDCDSENKDSFFEVSNYFQSISLLEIDCDTSGYLFLICRATFNRSHCLKSIATLFPKKIGEILNLSTALIA